MSAKTSRIIRELTESVKKASTPRTQPYDTQATVTRIEDGVAWVHIPGGVDETPVKLTINAAVGDTVQVRVSGGRAFLVGNSTAPPTDDKLAKTVQKDLGVTNKIVTAVKKVAERASKIATSMNQYFWVVESGTSDNGVHITQIPQSEFQADPESGGGNLLATSNGIAVRDGLEELATFGAGESRIGSTEDGEYNTRMSSNGINYYLGDMPIVKNNVTLLDTDNDSESDYYQYTLGTANDRAYFQFGSEIDPDPDNPDVVNPKDVRVSLNAFGGGTNNATFSMVAENGDPAIAFTINNSITNFFVKKDGVYLFDENYIIDLLNPVSHTLPIQTTYGSLRLWRYGKIGQLTIINPHPLTTGDNIICYLPGGWRPPADVVHVVRHPTDTYQLRATIKTNGEVVLYNYSSAVSGDSNVSETLTYIIA